MQGQLHQQGPNRIFLSIQALFYLLRILHEILCVSISPLSDLHPYNPNAPFQNIRFYLYFLFLVGDFSFSLLAVCKVNQLEARAVLNHVDNNIGEVRLEFNLLKFAETNTRNLYRGLLYRLVDFLREDTIMRVFAFLIIVEHA